MCCVVTDEEPSRHHVEHQYQEPWDTARPPSQEVMTPQATPPPCPSPVPQVWEVRTPTPSVQEPSPQSSVREPEREDETPLVDTQGQVEEAPREPSPPISPQPWGNPTSPLPEENPNLEGTPREQREE